MGFKSVYRVLMDVFPQVDIRILRAVAIENSKDADKAVEVVLMEVIPQIADTSDSANNSLDNASHEENNVQSGSNNMDETVGFIETSSRDDGKGDGDPVSGSDREQVVLPVKLNNVVEPSQSTDGLSTFPKGDDLPSNLECLVWSNLQQLHLDVNSSAMKLDPSAVIDFTSPAPENGLQQANDVREASHATHISSDIPVNFLAVTDVVDFELEPKEEFTHELVDFEHEPKEEESTHELVVFEHEPKEEESADELVDFEHEPKEEESTHELVVFEHEPKQEKSTHELVDLEHEGMEALNTEVFQSSQICRIDLLEDIIKEARDNKRTLFSAMESVMSLMREAEVREKAAEQAKEEAARGPLDVLASVDNLKQMLIHAREANDMHAGEVYGEKAILATEAKELQSRLLCLSEERDNSLAILKEMRQTLEDRLDLAEKAMKAAEQEKTEKEECARKALTEQQLIMDKLVQESKMLKQEAEENSKLQEFLMDRGSVVDMLQGEISVICQDVKLLKQKFDEKVPLSESLSSSQTSCRLASSSSSLKSLSLDLVPVQIEPSLETPKIEDRSPTPSISDHLSTGEERVTNDFDALVDDDGWELCDNKELNM